jgi:hypothetical protein
MKTHIEQQIESTLNSLDAIQPAEISPYFKTRMKGMLTQIQPEPAFISFKFTLAMATIAIILTANTFLLYQRFNQNTKTEKPVQNLGEISEIYHLNSTPVLDYDNQ